MDFTYRIIDANYNRSREGLRVMEEYARFGLNDPQLSESLKTARHELCGLVGRLPGRILLDSRDTPGDVGTGISLASEARRDNVKSVLKAASARVCEALRSIEEYSKVTIVPEIAAGIEQLRYRVYDLEKTLLARLTRAAFGRVQVYVLITEELCRFDPVTTAKEALRGGADCIQFREKELQGRQTVATALEIARLCREHGAIFIINDRCDLAQACGADGVHLGQSDLPPDMARNILGYSAILGRTCHNLDEVSVAKSEDIDYIGIGSIFGSPTKPEVARTGTKFIADSRKIYDGPIIAIGGVTATNAREAIEAGATGVAVCQAIISAEDPAKATEKMKMAVTGNAR